MVTTNSCATFSRALGVSQILVLVAATRRGNSSTNVQLTFSSSVGAVHGTDTFAAVDVIMPGMLIVLPDSPCCVGTAAGVRRRYFF
jgi:hypothetical protein